jgi:phosphatidylethanolamine/phosphatidyl-N-methylethanolamine N-methyltransferase
MTHTHALTFFRAWTARPLRMAAIVPSGKALATLITQEISSATGPVLELGAGTGAVTEALLDRGVPETCLTLVDCETSFAIVLHRRFPAARVRCIDAADLQTARLFAAPIVGAVVSSVPVLTMPTHRVLALLNGAFAVLAPHGALYQCTYGPFCPIRRRVLDRLGLKAVRVGHTLHNLPPASVYRITRRVRAILGTTSA